MCFVILFNQTKGSSTTCFFHKKVGSVPSDIRFHFTKLSFILSLAHTLFFFIRIKSIRILRLKIAKI